MAGALRNITRKIIFVLTLLCCVFYLLALLPPLISPVSWWPIGFFGLAFPYLFTLLIFIVLFWLMAKPRYSLLPFLVLLLGYKQINVLFGIHFYNGFKDDKLPNTLRIVDWNVGNMYGLSNNTETRKHNRTEIAGIILNQKPDIICLQEFNHSTKQGEEANNIALFSKQYPYYYFSRDVNRKDGYYQYGSIIFSRYPIIDTGKIKYPHFSYESLVFADIKYGDDTIRFYTSHLQSFKFSGNDYSNMDKVAEADDETLSASKSLASKMKIAFKRRSEQADVVNKEISVSPHPSIMCGDFNDVPNSYTYFTIRGLRQDAFLKKDFGIGKSYNALAPTLRIDYILPDTTFNVHQFNMIDEALSDHYMLVSDVSLSK